MRAQTNKVCVGVGPLLPSPTDTIKAYTPIFDHLTKQLGVELSLVSTTDWAGMAVAMGSGQLDVAWMGPWGYIIANNHADCTAIATVHYEEKPTYLAIVIAKPDLKVAKFPDDTKACRCQSLMSARPRAGSFQPISRRKFGRSTRRASGPIMEARHMPRTKSPSRLVRWIGDGFRPQPYCHDRKRQGRRHRSDIAVVFRQFNLIGRRSALGNVLAGRLGHVPTWRGITGRFSREDKLWALECLDRVGMLDYTERRADTLSGGQQQRVAIARAIAQRHPGRRTCVEPRSADEQGCSRPPA
jgi:ABC-type dipeptide/oligopeptide/nickel transport system ATPase subunit